MNFYSQNGSFPNLCLVSGYGIWDKTTVFNNAPSFASTGYLPVVGDGTDYSLKLNFQQMGDFFWNCSGFTFDIGDIEYHYAATTTIDCGEPPEPKDITTTIDYSFGGGILNTGVFNSFPTDRKTFVCPLDQISRIQSLQGDAGHFTINEPDCEGDHSRTLDARMTADNRSIIPVDLSRHSPYIIFYNGFYYPFWSFEVGTEFFFVTTSYPGTTFPQQSTLFKIRDSTITIPYWTIVEQSASPPIVVSASLTINNIKTIPYSEE